MGPAQGRGMPVDTMTETEVDMDFRVGKPDWVGRPGDSSGRAKGQIEARILAVRPPRRQQASGRKIGRERRANPEERDPRGGRVLVLMIPDGQQLPAGVEKGNFRVFLRFVRR